MLHEVLLALSGHPSPLFRSDGGSRQLTDDCALLSPSEAALLQSIGELSELHRRLCDLNTTIASRHSSMIARAVGTSIKQTHLARFQTKILDVERNIFTRDTSTVGSYEIVPLAGIVGEFDEWHRRMAWYWKLATYMQPPNGHECSGASLIDKLRAESHTGFRDIEEAAIELSRVAETAWLRQLSSWLLHGKLPIYNGQDFFIQLPHGNVEDASGFRRERTLMPTVMTPSAASAALFIGRSLHQIKQYEQRTRTASSAWTVSISNTELISKHLSLLSSMSLPLVPAQLARTISAIRLSLSQNVLQKLLPMTTTLHLLACLRQFFLLSRGEFGGYLVIEAETRMCDRQQSMGRLLQQDPIKALQGFAIKDAELHQTLEATWKALAREDEDGMDSVLDFARVHITLSTPKPSGARPSSSDSVRGLPARVSSVQFNNLLFPTATSLHLNISPPLDLILSEQDLETYATVNTYLLSIERAQLRLSGLWRRSTSRRAVSSSRTTSSFKDSRARGLQRARAMRRVWATCSAAIFLISETAAYFEGEVVQGSSDHFEAWVKRPVASPNLDPTQSTMTDAAETDLAQRDPETIASGHRAFLASLVYALLLTDLPYTRDLRSLLGNVDSLIAFFNRLLDIQQKLDVEHQSGGESALTSEDERSISLELDRARKKVDSDLRSVVQRLRHLDQERIGSLRYLDVRSDEAGENMEFEAWKGGGLDRLLMKVDGRVAMNETFDLLG